MKVLITGITGMVGTHFREILKGDGHEVWGVARNSASSRLQAIEDERFLRCDILERDALECFFYKVYSQLVGT